MAYIKDQFEVYSKLVRDDKSILQEQLEQQELGASEEAKGARLAKIRFLFVLSLTEGLMWAIGFYPVAL